MTLKKVSRLMPIDPPSKNTRRSARLSLSLRWTSTTSPPIRLKVPRSSSS